MAKYYVEDQTDCFGHLGVANFGGRLVPYGGIAVPLDGCGYAGYYLVCVISVYAAVILGRQKEQARNRKTCLLFFVI